MYLSCFETFHFEKKNSRKGLGMITLTMYYVAQGWCVTCIYACEGVEFTKDRKKNMYGSQLYLISL